MNLSLSNRAKVRLYKEPVDMRYGMFRLQSLIYPAQGSTEEGAYHFFVNRPISLLKVVWFDGTGLCLLIKRLEKGGFSWPSPVIRTDSQWVEPEQAAAPETEAPGAAAPVEGAERKHPVVRKRKLKLTDIRTYTHRLIPREVQEHPELYELMEEAEPRCSYRLGIVPAHLRLDIYECPAFVPKGGQGEGKGCATPAMFNHQHLARRRRAELHKS